MLFVTFIVIIQAIITNDDSGPVLMSAPTRSPLPAPIPISVPIDIMTNNNSGKCNEDINCDSNINNPECGKKCWSGKSSEDYFEYTFKGVKFEVYGSRAPNNGKFNLLLNGTNIETINLNHTKAIHRTLVYTSKELLYGTHTIRVQGIQDEQFELYKFTYWPSLQAIRVNVSDLTTSGSWTSESDKIGGTREYSNSDGASKSGAFSCSKVWIYGSKANNHGTAIVEFANKEERIDEQSSTREDLSLIYESEKVPFQLYALSIKRSGTNAILINFIYYLSDAPFQTPAPKPTQSPIPNSAKDYIDKTFKNTLPNGQILIQPGSNVKQISGCHFINIDIESKNYFIRPETEVQIFNNIFEYTDLTKTYSSPIFADYNGNLEIRNCQFIKARCTKVVGGDANVLSVNSKLHTIFDSCTFTNCGTGEEKQLIIRQAHNEGSLQLIDCIFTFDDVTKSCKVFYVTSSNVVVNRCTFTKCGKDTLNVNVGTNSNNGIFQFTDNVVQNVYSQFILINGLKSKPIIDGNTFQDITIASGYFITINHNQEEIRLYNNTFTGITSGNGATFGGSLSSWFAREGKSNYSITYEKCKFINMVNSNTQHPYNQGGAIQYGYSTTISNVSMIFEECQFKGNRCPNGKGGALAISINNNLYISNCIFEDNQAAYEGGAIYIWGYMFDMNTAGNITIGSQMETITITNCQFDNNKGQEGQVLYIESEYIGNTKLEITGNTFTNNGEDNIKFMIWSSCRENMIENNKVEYTDESKTTGAIYFDKPKIVTINNCNFINCISKSASTLGFVPETLTDADSIITITNTEFLNCIHLTGEYTIFIPNCLADFDNVTISFNDLSKSNGGINFGNKGFSLRNSKIIRAKHNDGGIKFVQASDKTNPITISNCIFDNCGSSTTVQCFLLTKQSSTTFTFENNVFQNMISNEGSQYIINVNINDNSSTFNVVNLTLINNTCRSFYGGGSGLWISDVGKLNFEGCNFINNAALRSPATRKQKPSNKDYFTGDGGGIQYGFTASIYNIELTFNGCLFRDNKAVRHGGGIAIQMNNNVEITNCIFENNIANYQTTQSKILYENYFDQKSEGRGGAIYINPTFTYTEDGKTVNGKTPSVLIEGCTFRSNHAYDGYAIYIEGEDDGTTFTINNNDFIDNYDSNSEGKSVIITEIERLINSQIISSNRFTYSNPEITIAPLTFVDHFGIPPTPSSTPIKTGANVTDNSSLKNLNNIGFDCVVDRGSVKVYLTCSKCAVQSNLYFNVAFEDQEISKITHDSRKIYPATNPTQTLSSFVLPEKIVLNKNNNSLSFNTGSTYIKYDRVENNIKCYVPFVENIFKDGDCSASERCDKVITEPRPVHVFIEISNFSNFNQTKEDGGAIHLIDCGLTCTDTPFINCAATEGGGGAIYIKNNLDYTNNITITGVKFNECKAKYGGAIYIYSESPIVKVQIKNCQFVGNHLIENNDSELKDGSAIFLNSRNGKVDGCKFSNNYGSESVCRILTSFKSKKTTQASIRKIESESRLIIFNECKFNSHSDSKSVIQFTIGNGGSEIEVNKCIFTGVLRDGAHFIDEHILDTTSPLLKIKACKFSYDIKRSLNLDPKHDLSLIDLNDQVFNYSDFNESKQSSWKLIIAIVLPAVAVVSIIVVIIIIVHKRNRHEKSEEQDNTKLTSNLIDSSLI